MNCKFCNAELETDVTVCPVCGKEQTAEEIAAVEELPVEEVAAVEEILAEEVPAEEVPAEEVPAEEVPAEEAPEEVAAPAKVSTKKLTAAIIALVLVAGILIGLFAGTIGSKPAEPTEPAETVAQIEIPSNGDPASPKCKASYTVSDEEAAAAADVVVATMGTETLTNGELQAFYWQEIYMFLMENYTYAQYMGLDLSRGLDTQLFGGGALGEDDMSWQQFFLDGAISSWKTYQALELEAMSAGFVLPEEEQKSLDNLESDMQLSATSYGFDSVDAMLQAQIGASCSMEDYYNYVQTYFMGMSYYYDFCENLAPADQEIEAHFAENEDYFTQNGITKDAKFVNVRHVLLQPEGGETGEDGYPVFTDEAWEACRVKVEELYNTWQAGDQSEESFAQLAMENSVDGSAQNGGLYENVYVGQMVPEFENWCFDESRVAGDHGLVKTAYGYHIMFFSAHRGWMDLAKENLISTIASDKIPQVTEQYASEVDFSAVKLARTTF